MMNIKIKYIFILCILYIVLPGCNKSEDIAGPSKFTDSLLIVKVDPRMELLAVIQHFTSWANTYHTKFNFRYKNDIDNYFSAYSKHSAVIKSQQLTNYGFNYDAPPTFVLYHNDPPEFQQIIPYSSYLIGRAGTESNLIDFADKIRSFGTESHFKDFYDSNKEFYREIEDNIKNTIGDKHYIKILEDYYGEKKNSYHIIPTPLFQSGGYGPQVESSNGKDVYSICGPQSVIFNTPYFGDLSSFAYILQHEFSHSFVNPVTAKYASEIDSSKSLFEPIKNTMTQQAYDNWQTCVNEHLVRVNVARFELAGGQANHDNIIQSELHKGFIYITNLDILMDRYEKNRAIYPTYESFYPEIIKLFDSLATTK